MPTSLDETFRHFMTIGNFFVLITGIIMCVSNRMLTRYVWLIAAGLTGRFALEVLQLLFTMLYSRSTDPSFFRYWFIGINLMEFGVWIVIVTGLTLSFRDIQDQIKLLLAMARRDTPHQ